MIKKPKVKEPEDFYVYRSDYGWYWVNRKATKSSRIPFKTKRECVEHAEKTLFAKEGKNGEGP